MPTLTLALQSSVPGASSAQALDDRETEEDVQSINDISVSEVLVEEMISLSPQKLKSQDKKQSCKRARSSSSSESEGGIETAQSSDSS